MSSQRGRLNAFLLRRMGSMTEEQAANSLVSSCKKKTGHIRTSAGRRGPLPQKLAAEAKEKFLTSFAKDGIVLNACRAAGVDLSAVRYWEEHDAGFSMRYNMAREDANDKLRDTIVKRAKKS